MKTGRCVLMFQVLPMSESNTFVIWSHFCILFLCLMALQAVGVAVFAHFFFSSLLVEANLTPTHYNGNLL